MMQLPSALLRFGRDRRGVATVEFALWSLLILSVLLVSADFGIFALNKLRLKRSVSEASIAAFNARGNLDPNRVAQYVVASAHIPGTPPTVSVTCNGGETCINTGRKCGCISLANGAFSMAGSCNAACPSGGLSGYYMTISAKTTYRHVILRNPWLDGQDITARVTVRLQ